jgi:hypothetical protein
MQKLVYIANDGVHRPLAGRGPIDLHDCTRATRRYGAVRLSHTVQSRSPPAVFLDNPVRKLFNAVFFLGPIGHFASAVRELRAPAPRNPTDYYGLLGNSRSLNRFFH